MTACAGCGGSLPTTHPRQKWCSERCRRSQYAGQCADCGAPTNGHDGPGKAYVRCSACSHAKEKAEARWTREAIIDAIRLFAATHGRAPTSAEWLRRRPAYYPDVCTIQRRLGSWNAAILAAGFEPRPTGTHRHDLPPETIDRMVSLRAEGLSPYAISKRIGCADGQVRYHLRKRGVA